MSSISPETAGSIPAYTGETAPFGACWIAAKVYPRIYGGNSRLAATVSSFQGLSPHIRGKLHARRQRLALLGSIPAYTGETYDPDPRNTDDQVYPRIYGGN